MDKVSDEIRKLMHEDAAWEREERKHIGFAKLKGQLGKKKGISDPGAVAAAIGIAKYGKAGMAAKAKAGKAKAK
jgi:hypothetical protein